MYSALCHRFPILLIYYLSLPPCTALGETYGTCLVELEPCTWMCIFKRHYCSVWIPFFQCLLQASQMSQFLLRWLHVSSRISICRKACREGFELLHVRHRRLMKKYIYLFIILVGVNDVGFARALVADVSSRMSIRSDAVFTMGYSNGAFMSERLACEVRNKGFFVGIHGTH